MGYLGRILEIYKHDGLEGVVYSIENYVYRNSYKTSIALTMLYSIINPKRPLVWIFPTTRGWTVWEWQNDSRFYVPHKKDVIRGSSYWHKNKFERYISNGFAEIEPDDLVVDAGAFRGEFTQVASKQAKEVIAIEPDPRNLWFLQNNVAENVRIITAALWNNDTSLDFLLGGDPTDSSVINVDSEDVATEVVVQGRRLDNLLAELDIDVVDFLKLDAEGAEPEVIEGLDDISVRKIAVDCNPEREGKSTKNTVRNLLSDKGFEVLQNESNIVFARQPTTEQKD